jgi:methyltransferase (TIGR00027 family)
VETGQPSRTAWAAATHRAVHQVVDGGRIFTDPLAVRILGTTPADLTAHATAHPDARPMRLFIAARTRFAEDALDAAVAAGTRQLVVLGAGLDTYAYRTVHTGLSVFEVDHPSTQIWKRERLAAAGLTVPDRLTFAPVDFETATLADGLAAAGFDLVVPTFFTWLGVVPYLTREAVFSTLRYIAGLPGGATVVFDYADPPAAMSPERRARHEHRANRVASIGEPWLSYFTADEFAVELRGIGYTDIDDLGPDAIGTRYFGLPAGRLGRAGAHLIAAGRAAD